MKKRIISAFLCTVMIISCFATAPFYASAASYEQQLRDAGFSDSYIDDLVALHNKYPKWEFKPLKTGLDWSSAVSNERRVHSYQVIERTSSTPSYYFCDCAKCSKSKAYWAPASQWAVEYYMDPRNWLNEKYIFQFESNEYNSANTQSGVEAIISSTWMKNANITYLDGNGKSVTYKDSSGNNVKYSKAIMDAAKDSKLSSYYIASRIVKEVGSTKATATGVSGNKAPFNGIYNYYSIGASSNAMQGLEWASGYLKSSKKTTLWSGDTISAGQRMSYIGESKNYYYVKLYTTNGSSYSTNGSIDWVLKSDVNTNYFSYNRPWTDPYKAIIGGAKYIAEQFSYQYTKYLEKFNVNPVKGNTMHSHEYMTNAAAPTQESLMTYKAYNDAGQMNTAKIFYIPVYKNMPATPTGAITGWRKLDGNWYYYNNGTAVKGWKKINGKWYYMNSDGVMLTGWQKISGKWYLFNSSGAMLTGWQKVSGKWYYLSSSGEAQVGWLELNGKRYYMNASCAMVVGWKKLNNIWYYFNSNGAMAVGWKKINGQWYYFAQNGKMLVHWQKIGNKWYYMADSGEMLTGWRKIKDKWYYFTESGSAQTGWLELKNKRYYFNDNCEMTVGWLDLDDKRYYMNSSGAAHSGWLELEGKRYYFLPKGEMATGAQLIDGTEYLFDENGALIINS